MVLWTTEHAMTLLPALIFMVILAAVLRLTLGKRSRKVRMIPLQVIAVLLIVLEVGKQTTSFLRGYDLYSIPLHFCSLVLFALPAMAFYRGKHESKVFAVTTALCAAVFLLTAIYPNLIYSAWDIRHFFDDFMCTHTVAFHNAVMLAFLLIPALNLHTPAKGDGKAIAVFIFIYCIIGATAAHVLKTNYNNFYQCNIPPLESLRQLVASALGQTPAQILYVVIVTFMDLGFVSGTYGLYRLCHKLLNKAK